MGGRVNWLDDALRAALEAISPEEAVRLAGKHSGPATFEPFTTGYSYKRQAFYDPKYWEKYDDPLLDENGNVITNNEKLRPIAERGTIERLIKPDPELMYRGMSAEELVDILLNKRVQSRGDMNFTGGQEGLTYFSKDPLVAESYSNSFAPSKYKPTMERPAYVISARRPPDTRVKNVPGTGSDEIGVIGATPLEDIVGLHRGSTTAYYPGIEEKGFSQNPSASLNWEPRSLDDLLRGRKNGGRAINENDAIANAVLLALKELGSQKGRTGYGPGGSVDDIVKMAGLLGPMKGDGTWVENRPSKWQQTWDILSPYITGPAYAVKGLMDADPYTLMTDTGPAADEAVANSFNAAGAVTVGGSVVPKPRNAVMMGIRAYHGSPHDFPPVRLIEMPDGQRLYQNMNELADTPQGAKIIQEYPLGRFDMSKIGTGEGAQAYGHGLYFAEAEDVARGYRDRLTDTMKPGDMTDAGKAELQNRLQTAYADMANRLGMSVEDVAAVDNSTADELFEEMKKVALSEGRDWFNFPKGSMYEVNIAADPNTFLDWDKPLSEQTEEVKKVLRPLIGDSLTPQPGRDYQTGEQFYRDFVGKIGGRRDKLIEKYGDEAYFRNASDLANRELGLPGIKYLDAGSRGKGVAQVQVMYKGQPHGDPIPAHAWNQVDQLVNDYKAKGYDTVVKDLGTRNYVVFDEKLISIIRKYGIAGASAMLGYNLMEQLDPKQALAASMADQDYQSSRPQRSMGGNNSVSGALNVARGLHGVK